MKPCLFLGAAVSLAAVLPCADAKAAVTEIALYSFGAAPDGQVPVGALVRDKQGNLYGATAYGGLYSYGTVFKLSPPAQGQTAWTETVLHNFKLTANGADGSYPTGSFIFDAAGNLYGTTALGGASNAGTVFELSPPSGGGTSWTEKVLYSFTGGADGLGPLAGIVFDRAGNLYGTTYTGGAFGSPPTGQQTVTGTVFELSPPAVAGGSWTETVLHSFNASASEGGGVSGGVIMDASGNLYGTTISGGHGVSCSLHPGGCGTVFRLTPPGSNQTSWTESLLYSFSNVVGQLGQPENTLAMDSAGNLYGATSGGIFKLTNAGSAANWPETILVNFTGAPGNVSGLTLRGRSLSGTSGNGGRGACPEGCGTVFSVSLILDKLATVHTFSTRHADGIDPLSGVIFDGAANAYGTTAAGGAHGNGMVFEIQKTP